MALESGTRFGSYEVTGQLGVGGMGEVYRATDTTLEREVAIKVLPQSFAADAGRIARFEQEAKLLASLNHANVAHVHGLEKAEGATAIVMELVEGPTLADRIAEGPIKPEEALAIAFQIIDALEAAHSRGIVHRDLKPANIKLKPDGTVKVLDFGIAKAFEPTEFLSGPSSPVMTTPVTQAGVILGTAAYMSPEQARGKGVDQRTDVWAFGCVLYEMLTGQPVFGGEDVTVTLARVLERDTDMGSLPAALPGTVRHTIRLCLKKNPKDRLHAIGDVRLALQGALENEEGTGPARAAGKLWLRTLPLAAAGLIAGLAVATAYWSRDSQTPAPVTRVAEILPDGRVFSSTTGNLVSVSPDGARVVYVANNQLFLRDLASWEARPVAGSNFATTPFFSRDGQWIGFRNFGDNQLYKVAVTGGAAVLLAPSSIPTGEPFWSSNDDIVWSDGSAAMSVSANGGVPEIMVQSGDTFVLQPSLLPDGDSILLALGDFTDADVAIHSLSSGETRILFPGNEPRYAPTGHIIYALEGVLLAVPFDIDTLTVTGGPVPIVEGVQGSPAQFDFSDTGTLAYVPGGIGTPVRVIGLVDRDGRIEQLSVPPKAYTSPRISPDGQRLLVQSEEPSGSVIWLYDLAGTNAIQQLTFEGDSHRPVWSPDGSLIVFSSDRDGTMSLYRMPADGSTGAERVTTAENNTSHWMGSFTPDGETVLFNVQRVLATDWDIWTVPIDGGEAQSLYDTPNTIYMGAELSPDGNWLAYSAGTTAAASDVYIEPFPQTGARRRISQAGGYWPLWSPGGDELFYRPVSTTAGITLRSVDIALEPNFGFSNERTHAAEGFQVVAYYRDYDVTPDGERLVMLFPEGLGGQGPDVRPQVSIVTNWFEELRVRVPSR